MATSALEVSITAPFISENTSLLSVLGCQFDNVETERNSFGGSRQAVKWTRSYNNKFLVYREVVPQLFPNLDEVMEFFSYNDSIIWNVLDRNKELYPDGEHNERLTIAEYPATGLECLAVLPQHEHPALTWLNDNRKMYRKYIVRNIEFKARRK